MSNKAYPGKQSKSYSIIEIIAMSGEFPSNQLYRFSGGGKYEEKLLLALKNKNLIRTFYEDRLRGLRITSKAKHQLLADNPERFDFYLTGNTDTNKIKNSITRRLRLHRIAETYITMRNAGVSLFRDEKPSVFKPGSPLQSLPNAAFYSSREVKEIGMESTKIRNTRSVGVLLTTDYAFIVYNAGDSLMKWDYNAESRLKAFMKMTLYYNRQSLRYGHGKILAMMLGNSMELSYQMLTNTGGIKGNYFVLDRDSNNFLYITNDANGELLLRILCSREIISEMNGILSSGYRERNPGLRYENDAVGENDEPILFAYDFNMPRIVRFNNALQLHDNKGTLICFDYQADVLRRYCCDNVSIQTIKMDKFKRRFFPSNTNS